MRSSGMAGQSHAKADKTKLPHDRGYSHPSASMHTFTQSFDLDCIKIQADVTTVAQATSFLP